VRSVAKSPSSRARLDVTLDEMLAVLAVLVDAFDNELESELLTLL
jgi:hypothetical protein